MHQQEVRKIRRIQSISVTNLFGIFNHEISLKMNDHITIIHGPNGFGKTMMLKLLLALFGQSNRLLQSVPFDEFRVDFEDDSSFWVVKTTESQKSVEGDIEQEIVFHATGKKAYSIHIGSLQKDPLRLTLSMVEHYVPSLDRVSHDLWRNTHTNELLTIEDVLMRFSDRFPTALIGERKQMPEWLKDMRNSVPIRLIETQRLLSTTKPSKRSEYENISEYAVTEDSRHLVEVIKKKLVESGALSQSLDSTFPARVIRPTIQQLQVTEGELLEKLEKLEKKRSRLMAIGLLDQETGTGFPIGPGLGIEANTKAVLAVYAEDTEQKLGIFDELAQKINLLTTIIDNRFLYKTMTVNKEKGFVFKTRNSGILPPENLSSGEQHELVLFYELLFRVTPGSLILIDEPELSLHVVWQEQFLKDVQQVTQLTDIDVILATHSPDIISDRRDLVVELREPGNGKLQRVSA